MKMTIGENIKRLRREKNITQEELAELFGVSCAAVSKWERSESYPDIALIFPLASYFSVSTDVLLGYDLTRREEEINAVMQKHTELFRAKKFAEAFALIAEAKKEYPDDFRVLNQYMWDTAGGFADNDPETLLAHKEEFFDICQKTIERCTDDRLRLGARNMQAKLLHAEGKTAEALEIYHSYFPDWYLTADQKAEQLFAKDTAEFRRALLLNQYALTDFAFNKKLKEIWFCRNDSVEEKAMASFALADALEQMARTVGAEFYLAEYHVLNDLGAKLRAFGADDAAQKKNREKIGAVAALCNRLAENDALIQEHIRIQYHKEAL